MLELVSLDPQKTPMDVLVVPTCQDQDIHTSRLLSALEQQAKDLEEFDGEPEQEVVFHTPKESRSRRVMVIGLGKVQAVNAEVLRAAAGRAATACVRRKLKTMHLAVPSPGKIKQTAETLLAGLMEGALLGNHRFDAYRSEKKLAPLDQIRLIASPAIVRRCSRLPAEVEAVCRAAACARDWVSTPSNDKRPEQFAQFVARSGRERKLKVRVLGEPTLQRGKFGGILAVAAGSDSKPALVVLDHNPPEAKKTVALVGKGVTFDSGGLNLKPTGSMEEMKLDMAGAAAVAATLNLVAERRLALRVIGLVPIVENMVSGKATRPGDIIRTYAGKTVEIGNTDAEGRLILADALAYGVEKYKPDLLVDMATLTGACVVALGERIAGVFSKDETWRQKVVAAGNRTGERCWPLPLPEDYRDQLKSDFADLKNIGAGRWGGAITAALFLSEFVGDSSWVHIDIAGPAYAKKPSAYCGAGGTGFGVRLLWELLQGI